MTDMALSGATSSLLRFTRYEIFPMKGMEERLRFLPEDGKVTVACVSGKGMDATLDLSEAAARHVPAANVTPHVPARMVESRGHLAEILGRCRDLGITGLFIIGGDAEKPCGPYRDSRALIEDVSDAGMGFSIGVGAYPQPHPNIPEEAHIQDLLAKQQLADYMVTQICFDAEVTVGWLNQVRDRGVALPVEIGVVGAVEVLKLMRIAGSLGLGNTLRFMRKSGDMRQQLQKNKGRYVPDDLCHALAAHLTDKRLNLRGLHIYTFNQVEETRRWHSTALQQSAAGAAELPESPAA